MRIVPYIIYLLLLGLHQVALKEFTTVYSVSINLCALVVVLVALHKSEAESMWFGFVAGVTVGATSPHLLGWYALVYAALGLVSYHVRLRMNLESRLSRVAMVAGAVFVSSTAEMFLMGLDGFFVRFLTVVLLGTVYTTALGWLFFLAREGVISYRRFKMLF